MVLRTIVFLIVFSISSISFAQENISPRSLFISPTGGRIEYKEEKRAREGVKSQVHRKEETPKTKATKEQYLGMEVQVLVPTEMGLRPIDHKSHVFSTGDRFKVQIFYNSPGVVEFYNENPEGKITYLGQWIVEQAFSGTVLPKDGWFWFKDKKGKDKLIIYFYPCQPQDKKVVERVYSMYSRDIGVIRDKSLSKLKLDENVYTSLPICSISESEKKREDYASASRNIIYVEEKTTRKTYYFASLEDYKANNKPVVAVLEFIHQ
ncbi:MAG: hypothetical protein N2327_02035 [Caldimicrobium sp.]|nr:hypothetical protein [Caldimicrobium sp.]MDW8095088.1 hypothetical protein [Caldimicrobium sp.]